MERGDIWHVDLNPTRGREQANPRFVLILTPKSFNQLGTPIVVPITTGGDFAREKGFAVSLSGAGTNASGVILCHQLRALDLKSRGAKFSEKVPEFIVEEVLARVAALFE
ncbi:MAG: type II toxin-antitoxin system PemK/MazF family toxin [Alphaproteobacteria bacterium]|nr:type II toxin-antitoxin system PemK/MazF family toxin [Alphaproteobacteria bacterium]